MAHDIEFFFDPVCPFAWQTSRWIHQVIDTRGLDVDWRFISLSMLNEGKYEDSDAGRLYKDGHAAGLNLLRVCAAVKADHGPEAVGRLYTEFGLPIWNEGVSASDVDVKSALTAAGLDTSYATAYDDESWDEQIRASTELAISRTGEDVGTPIITYGPPDGNSLFGPVISSLPTDEQAVEMYDAIRVLVDFETFSEIKRSKRPPLDLPAFK